MEVQVLSRKFIKPSTPTPNHLRTHKLSLFDQVAPPIHIPFLFFYPSDGISTTNEKLLKLQKSLSDTLTLFYPQSGRFIKEDLIVDCSDQGVEFFEAKVNVELKEWLSLLPKRLELLNHFVPWDIGLTVLPTTPMVAFQVTVFECGGLAICMRTSHMVSDGFTMTAFINAWATASRLGIGEVVRPRFDLSSICPPRDIAREIVDILLPTISGSDFKVVTRVFLFDAAKIAELKDKLGGFGEERKPSRVEVVISVVWKALVLAARARNEGRLRNSILKLTFNLRGFADNLFTRIDIYSTFTFSKHNPMAAVRRSHFSALRTSLVEASRSGRTALPMPENLGGNFYIETPTKYEPEQNTTELDHHLLVHLIRESIETSLATFGKLSDGDEITSAAVNFLNQVGKSTLDEEVDVHHFTSRCRFPLYDSDFGWGKPCLVTPICLPLEMVALMDTKCGTGIEAWVSLNETQMLELEKDLDISGLTTYSCSTDGKILYLTCF